MELERFARAIWKWLWLILLAAGVAGVSSYLATRSAPRIYQTKTTIMVGQFIKDPAPESGDFWISQQLGQTYAQLALRQPVLQGALEDLNLADQMDWQALGRNVRVTQVAGTQLMEISVNDTIPYRAKALADAIAQQLILQSPSNPGSDQEDRTAFAQGQLEDLELKIQDAEQEIAGLQAELDDAISARRIQDLETQIDALQEKVTAWQSSYAQFLTFLQGGEVNYLTVVESAPVPSSPISPNVMMNSLLAMAIGAALAVGAALLLEFMDDTIKTMEDARRISPYPILGTIGRIEDEDSTSLPVAARTPGATVVEAYRALRTNLQLSSGILSRSLDESPASTIVITSADRLEGKSTTAANLAAVMSQGGLRTLLVDADLRRPVQHQKFDLAQIGLTEALVALGSIGRHDNPSAAVLGNIQATAVENLQVMTGGHFAPYPAELLGSSYMKQLIGALKAEVDVILFDTPPAAVVTDAVVLAAQVDGIVLIISQGHTRWSMFKRAVEALDRSGTPILGIVVNRVADRSDGYYPAYRRFKSDEEKRSVTGRVTGLFSRFVRLKRPQDRGS